jgi:hypothetical protein
LDGAIEFVCKDLLSGKRVTYFQSLSSKYGNFSESKLRELRNEQWANWSDEYKLKWSKDKKKWWDDKSDEFMQEWSEDRKKWWYDQRKLSSGSTEEAPYYPINGANEDGTYVNPHMHTTSL